VSDDRRLIEVAFPLKQASLDSVHVDMLAVLEQNPSMEWSQLVDAIAVEKDRPSDVEIPIIEDGNVALESDGLADFRL